MTQIYEICPGVRVHCDGDKRFKTVNIGIYLYRKMDEAAMVSHMALLPFVLRQGCEKYPTAHALAMELENLFGASLSASVSKRGEVQIIRLGTKAILDQYCLEKENVTQKALSLLFEMLFHPLVKNDAFSDSILQIEKQGLIDEIKSVINDKKEYAMQRCFETMCEHEAYALSENGTIEEVEKITPASLYRFYRELITTAPMDIFISGDMDEQQAKETALSYVPQGNRLAYPSCELSLTKTDVRHVTDKMDINQGKLCMGFKTGISTSDDNYFPLLVGNEIFGGGPASKLFNNVREKMSLCYYVFSRLESLKGLMIVSCGVEFKNFEVAKQEILKQLEDVKKGNFTKEEFDNSLLSMNNALKSMRDSQRSMQSFAVSQILRKTGDLEQYEKKLNAVTPEDVVRAFSSITLDTVYQLQGKTKEA